MFFFPIGTDRPLRSTPWVNYALIAVNVLVFFYMFGLSDAGRMKFETRFMLFPSGGNLLEGPSLVQYLTYQFLHAGFTHIVSNMTFLYAFGNVVEDRLGKVGYLFFYLACGVVAGLFHGLTSDAPVVGASGAVAGVSGAFLVLFPRTYVTIFAWIFLYIDTFEVSGMTLIVFFIALDLVMQFLGSSMQVAYSAHLAGYTMGFTVAMALLASRLLERERYDLLALIEHRRKRASFRQMTRKGYQPWEAARTPDGVPAKTRGKAKPPTPEEAEVMRLRHEIGEALRTPDTDAAGGELSHAGAAKLYLQLLAVDPNQVMAQQPQLDLANQLMSDGRYDAAARAYELFLSTYRTYPQRAKIELILGLIYARYLRQNDRAAELLEAAVPRLDDADDRSLAAAVLGEMGRAPLAPDPAQ